MTMQVCLVGTDGIVLASDEKRLFYENGIMTSSQTPKMLTNHERGIAVAFSGCEISESLAQIILNDETISDFENQRGAVQSLADRVYKEWFLSDPEPPLADCGEILIVSSRTLNQFYSLDINKRHRTLRTITDKKSAGHQTNTACFFVESYYRKINTPELKFLAAHTILSASRLNSVGIKGLQIITCTGSGFLAAAPEEIESLTARSNALDESIRREIYRC
jgi:hypothetical protein